MHEQFRYLESLDPIELASQKRIEEGGLFLGCDPLELEERATTVQLREGWDEFASTVLRHVEHHVISVGWSARFIRKALLPSCQPHSICANEIEIDVNTGRGSGRLTKSTDGLRGEGGLRIAQHKEREMKRIFRDRRATTVYAGDSNTDLICLLSASVGLVLGDGEGIKNTLDRVGMREVLCEDVTRWMEERRERRGNNLVMVKNWGEAIRVVQSLYKED